MSDMPDIIAICQLCKHMMFKSCGLLRSSLVVPPLTLTEFSR